MRKVYCGIDIGTYHVKVIIASPADNPDMPMQIVGTGTATSRGMRHGYIVDRAETARSIKEAIARASSAAHVQVKSARIGLGGVGIDEIRSTGDVTLTPSGGIVTDREIERAMRDSEKRASSKLVNRTIIHTIPLEYRVDGAKVFGKPASLQGTKLAVDTMLITMLTQHHDDLIEAVEAAGVEVEGVMNSSLAASLVTLTKAQKTAGVVLANIGAETLSILVFDNDIPVSIKVLPMGSSDITNTIALSFQIPLTEAEQMKRGALTGSDIAPRKMESIISTRLKEMFSLVNAHLKAIGRSRLLPAGIVIIGGGAGIASSQEIAKAILKLPAQQGQIGHLPRSASIDATWAVAYGLCKWAYMEDMTEKSSSLVEVFESAWGSIKKAFRSLLP